MYKVIFNYIQGRQVSRSMYTVHGCQLKINVQDRHIYNYVQGREVIGAWDKLPMPVIAAIDGVALGNILIKNISNYYFFY